MHYTLYNLIQPNPYNSRGIKRIDFRTLLMFDKFLLRHINKQKKYP